MSWFRKPSSTPLWRDEFSVATSARLGYPTGVAVDSAGNLYIADYAGRASAPDSSGHTVEFAVNQKGRPTRRL